MARTDWKKAAAEMEWALGKAYSANHDRNPNRHAQVTVALEFGLAVGIAARSGDPLPPRPEIELAV